MKSNSDWNWM